MATTILGSAVAMLTATVVNVALPTIAGDLDASSAEQTWVINAYLLPVASLILLGGALGDRFGRVRLYRIGVAWFAVASVACALAPGIQWLIAARFLQGIGGALLTPGSLAIIETTLRSEDRGRGIGSWSGLGGVAGAVGPFIGGLLVAASWRWVFMVNVPFALAVLVLSVRLPDTRDPDAIDERLDVLGAVLTAVGLGAVTFSLVQGPSGGWSGGELAAGAAGLACLGVLAVHERRLRKPLFPVDLLALRPVAAANAITFVVYGGMAVVFFLLTIQLQVTAGWSPVASGLALLPVTLIMLVLSSRAGALAARIGPRWPLTAGPVLIAAGMLLLTRVGPDARYLTDVLPGAAVFGLGLACTVAPVTSTALGSVPDARAGAASGLNNAVSLTGQLLAVASLPALVGLTGDSLRDPVALDNAFPSAMLAGAVIVGLGAVIAAVALRPADECPTLDMSQCPVAGAQGGAVAAQRGAPAS
jgi:EmrB/QacA subfamily drug resistance transporter